jgi:hypothetical protein
MSYTKPEITGPSDAVKAIRGNDKGWIFVDNVLHPCPPLLATSAAYESDE